MRLRLLGTGTSFGVPQIGCDCPVCRSDDERDRRTRVGAYLADEDSGRSVLLDTPPELRLQLTQAGITSVDAVLYTHAHADHVHGIDDLRALSVKHGPIPLYASSETLEDIRTRFDYIFDSSIRAPNGSTKPNLEPRLLEPGVEQEIAGFPVLPIDFPHGSVSVLGFRIGDLGYVTDAKSISDSALRLLSGVKVLVLNALFEKPHPTHLSIPEAIEAAAALGAQRTILTHLTHHRTHRDLADSLPPGVEPGYDGLTVEL